MPSSANIPHSLCHQDNRTDKSVIKTRSCCFVFNAPVSPPQPWSHFTAKLGWLRLTRQLPFFFFFTTPSHAASCWTEVTFYAILFIKLYSWPDEGGGGSSFHSKFYDISFFFLSARVSKCGGKPGSSPENNTDFSSVPRMKCRNTFLVSHWRKRHSAASFYGCL